MDGSKVPDTAEQKRKLSAQELDYFDPNLDVQDLFASFNERFFWGMLGMVQVKWSYTMTSRAGLCTYQEREGLCTIKLSAPLLSPRPRTDLAEALLHEMIHAYLFVTQNFKNEEDHGPEFQKHMHRINKEGGIKINIYYPYLNEMSYNRRHIWRCTGPCRDQQPYFGFVMRTENKPPGPSDDWWHTHLRECGGNFENISHKQKNGKEKNKSEKGKRKKTVAGAKDGRTFSRSYGPEKPSKSNPSDTSSTSTAVDESDKDESFKSMEQTEEKPNNSNEMEAKPGTSQSGIDLQSQPSTSQSGIDFQSQPSTSQSGTDLQSQPSTSQSGTDLQSQPSTSQSGTDLQSQPSTSQSGIDLQSQPSTSQSGIDFQSQPSTSQSGTDLQSQPSTSQSGTDLQSQPSTGQSGIDLQSQPSTGQYSDDFQSQPSTGQYSDDFQSQPGTSQYSDENSQPEARRTTKKGLKGRKRKSSDLESDEPDASVAHEKRPIVICPVCGHGFDPISINDHVNACMEEQQFINEISPDEDDEYGHGHYEHCPLLADYYIEDEAAERVEASLHFYVYDEDIIGDDEPGADKVRCPCCWKWVKERKINEHIDACLTYNTLQNNPPDSP